MILKKALNIILVLIPISLFFSIGLSSILSVLCFIGSVGLWIKIGKPKINPKEIDMALLIYILIGFFSVINSSDITSGLDYLKKILLMLGICLSFLLLRTIGMLTRKLQMEMFLSFVISAWFFCLLLLFSSISNIVENHFSWTHFFLNNVRFKLMSLSPIRIHNPYFGMLLLVAMLMAKKLYENKLLKKWMFASLIFSFMLYVYLNGSMNSIGTLFVLAIFFLIHKTPPKSLKHKGILAFIILSFISILFALLRPSKDYNLKGYWETPKYRVIRLLKEGDPDRTENWKSAISVFKENWVYGTGAGDLLQDLQSHRDPEGYNYKNKVNAHNQFLQEMVAKGILGLVSLLFLLFCFFRKYWSTKDFFVLGVLILFTLGFMTESILNRQLGIILFLVLLCLNYEELSPVQK